MKTKQYLNKRNIAYFLLYVSGPVFFALVNPNDLPLVLLVLPFAWLFSVLFLSIWLITGQYERLGRRKRLLLALVMSIIPVVLFVFQSVSQLSPRDVVLSFGLIGLAILYIARADFIN